MALMAGYTPVAAVMLALLVPIFEPLGLTKDPPMDTLIGYPYTLQVQRLPQEASVLLHCGSAVAIGAAVTTLAVSACCGLLCWQCCTSLCI